MTRRINVLVAAAGAAVVVGVLSGCSSTTQPSSTPPPADPTQPVAESSPPGDIPDNQAFVVYTAADNSYSVKYPEGWARTTAGPEVMFSDKFNSITLAPHDGFYQPTEAYARTVEMPQIAATTLGFTPGQISTVSRSAGQVVLITYQATPRRTRSPGSPSHRTWRATNSPAPGAVWW